MALKFGRYPRSDEFLRVLFLSTGNAARSPIAESVLRWLSRDKVATSSAGVTPSREVHPLARAAVRRIFNGRIDPTCPKSVAALEDGEFDYVFTLSPEAEVASQLFSERPTKVHWPLEDPAATHGSRDQRKVVFERLTRDLIERIQAWLRSLEPPESVAPARRRNRPRRRPATYAQWRTLPDADAPILVVAHFGPARACSNMCGMLERSGFHVLCAERYGREPKTVSVIPHGVVVRVDGDQQALDDFRPEFRATQELRAKFTGVPILVLGDHVPTGLEQRVLSDCGANFFKMRPRGRGDLIKAIENLIGQRSGK